MEKTLPSIPAKRYFTIGEVADLCGVKPHVLRYWEQEFTQLRPMKRRGNRRYYQHHEVLMIRRIRDLLYDQGFTINGARHRLEEITQQERSSAHASGTVAGSAAETELDQYSSSQLTPHHAFACGVDQDQLLAVARELLEIRDLLTVAP